MAVVGYLVCSPRDATAESVLGGSLGPPRYTGSRRHLRDVPRIRQRLSPLKVAIMSTLSADEGLSDDEDDGHRVFITTGNDILSAMIFFAMVS